MSVAVSTPPTARPRAQHEIADAIQAKLAASSYLAVHRVRCECDAGILTLTGTLPSFYAVQVAISL